MKYTIVIPAYNSEKFIFRPLNSLINQAYKNLEIIVVNDGSKDNTEQVVKDFIKDNPSLDIKYRCIENSGPSTARNVGIELASGDYICFLDSDDAYDEKLFEEIEQMISDDIDIIYWGTDEHDEDGNFVDKYENQFTFVDDLNGLDAAKKKFTHEIWFNNCNEIYKLSIIKDNNIRYLDGVYAGEDANFIYRCCFNAKKVKCLPKDYFHQTVRKDSLFRDRFSEKFLTEFTAIENTLKYIEDHNVPEVYPYIYSLYYYTRISIAKRLVANLRWYQAGKFQRLNRKYIPKIKKKKPLILHKKQKLETRIYNFDKVLFFLFVKTYYRLKKK